MSGGTAFRSMWYEDQTGGTDHYSGSSAFFPAKVMPNWVQVGTLIFVAWNGELTDETHPWGAGWNLIRVAVYDTATQAWTMGSDVVGTVLSNNAHCAPAITVDDAGRIVIWYYCHSSKLRMRRTVAAGDILGAWETVGNFGTAFTYPQPHKLGGNWQVLGRELVGADRKWYLHRFTDDGTFIESKEIISEWGVRGAYGVSVSDGTRLHLAWCEINWSTVLRHNLYYIYSDDGGDSWCNSSGVAVTLPIDESQETAVRVYDSGTDQLKMEDMVLVNGEPVVLVNSGGQHKAAVKSGTTWTLHDIGPADHLFDVGAIRIGGAGIQALLPSIPSQSGHDGGGMVMHESGDGVAWDGGTTVVSGAANLSHNFAIGLPHDDIAFMWSSGDSTPSANQDGDVWSCDANGVAVNLGIGTPSPTWAAADIGPPFNGDETLRVRNGLIEEQY